MRPKWLIESDKFGDDLAALMATITKCGFEYKVAHYLSGSMDSYLNLFDKDDCVIYYGSLGFACQVRREAEWIPGCYFHPTNYDCNVYYPALGQYLLNSNYIMLPFGELKRKKDFLYRKLGWDNTIFLRPNSGLKTFTGQLIFKELFEHEVDNLGYDIAPHDLIVVAQPRNIVHEWRFVIVDKQVIAGSQYRFNGHKSVQPNNNVNALDLAQKVAGLSYQPHRVWIADICQTRSGRYYLLEAGAFSCAGLYKCDLTKVVQEVSKIALEEWKEYR